MIRSEMKQQLGLNSVFYLMLIGMWLVFGCGSTCADSTNGQPSSLLYDFGTLPIGRTITHTFEWVNTNAEPLDITGIESSCECVTIQSFPGRLEHGQSGEIQVTVTPFALGPVEYVLTILSPRARLNLKPLILRGNITEAAPILPASRDMSVYISAPQLFERMTQQPEGILVDVRDNRSYTDAYIPDSLNIPLYALRSKAFLRNKPVILLDEAWNEKRLEEACQQLTDAGFQSVSVLYGGLAAWQHHGGSIKGQSSAIGRLKWLPAQALLEVEKLNDWIVIAMIPDSADGHITHGAQATNILVRAGDRNGIDHVKKILVDRKGYSSILMVTPKGDDYDDMAEMLALSNEPVFYLSGGWDAFVEYRQMMTVIQQRKTETIAGGMESSPDGHKGKKRGRTGCAGCPG